MPRATDLPNDVESLKRLVIESRVALDSVSSLFRHREIHPEHQEMLEWCGGTFDPRAFDINRINRQLKRIKL